MLRTRQGALADGPAWAAPEKHRHSITLRLAVRPVSEGLGEDGAASGEDKRAIEGIATSWDAWGLWQDQRLGAGKKAAGLSPLGNLCLNSKRAKKSYPQGQSCDSQSTKLKSKTTR